MALTIAPLMATKYGGDCRYAVFALCKTSKKGLRTVYLLHYFTGILWLRELQDSCDCKLPKSQNSGVCSMTCVFWGLEREFIEICILGNLSQDTEINLSVA